MPEQTAPEAWMRGVAPGIHPVIGHLLRAAEQIREDVESGIGHLTVAELWAQPHGMTSVGFHARHLAGSTERLCTYLEGRQLTPDQLEVLKVESIPGTESGAELLISVNQALDRYETLVRSLDPEHFGRTCEIGRRRYQTTVVSVAIHIAEHCQRHVGGLIAVAKLARAAEAQR